ncbi:flavodoxin family protein [bacterium]|nr:flavodoxin family protein [candidate division CSSED10-310 bacterium]
MKVIAFNGSPREEGNTRYLLNTVREELEGAGIAMEIVQLGGKRFQGCIACGKCFELKNHRCIIQGDIINDCIDGMREADGIILGSPTYFGDLTPELKCLIDRAGMVAKANGDMLKRKAGAAVASVRRTGALHVLDSITHFFTIGQMIVVGSSYWNMGIGLGPGAIQDDSEGIETMKTLGRNMAWLLSKIA